MFRRAGRDLGLIHQVEAGNKGDNCLRMREISPRYFQFFLFSEFGVVTRFSMRGISEHEL